jgi:hypothetical protein
MKQTGDNDENSEACPNRCYYYEFAYGSTMTVIFYEEFHAHYTYDNEQWREYHRDVDAKINYWKENDRYLIKLMEDV